LILRLILDFDTAYSNIKCYACHEQTKDECQQNQQIFVCYNPDEICTIQRYQLQYNSGNKDVIEERYIKQCDSLSNANCFAIEEKRGGPVHNCKVIDYM